MRDYPSVGVVAADVLLPRDGIDLRKWATIACDQFTSQPEYWQKVEEIVGDSPSTYHMILPEVFLGKPQENERIQSTQKTIREYLDGGIFTCHTGFVYVERTVLGRIRHGLMMAIDLEKYNYNAGSQSQVRATEGTILDRLPPRMRIREGAAVEIPHILILIDDPQGTVIEPVTQKAGQLPELYNFELMLGSGQLRGAWVDDLELEQQIIAALEKLASPDVFYPRYGVDANKGVLLFAAGDGNHSLATAKAIWEKMKPNVGINHPGRYALVEVENVHDEGLRFEPIHRVLFGLKAAIEPQLEKFFSGRIQFEACANSQAMAAAVNAQTGERQGIGMITPQGCQVAWISQPESNLPVGTLQPFLDELLKNGAAASIDYLHGEDVLLELGSRAGNCGFYLPAMDKSDLFKTVILDGALPRKTFSMGEAVEKRFYMEARKIV